MNDIAVAAEERGAVTPDVVTPDKVLSRFYCQFSDPAREDRYQKSVWPLHVRYVRTALVVGSVAFALGLAVEMLVLDGWQARLELFELFAVAHIGVALFALLVAHASYAESPTNRLSTGLVGFAAAYSIASVVIVKAGAIGWNDYAATVGLSVVYIAIFVPNRIPYTLASIGMIMGGYFGVIPFLSGVEINPRIVLVNILIAVLCVFMIRRRATNARADFARLEELRRSRDEMVGELGEARFHREAFEQTATEGVTMMEELDFLRQDLEQSSNLMTAILDNISQGVSVFDEKLEMVAWNRGFEELLHVPDDLLRKGLKIGELIAFNIAEAGVKTLEREKVAAETLLDLVDTVLDKGECYSYERSRADGKIIEVTSHPMPGGGIVNTYTDVTERKRAEQMARHMAEHDSLTGLANRAAFDATLVEVFEEHERVGTKSAVALLDLDGFKPVNDTFGHPVGDLVLCEVAKLIRNAVRDIDVAARIGGDEFAIVFRSIGSAKDAEVPVQRIISALQSPLRIEDHNVVVGISAGIACCPEDAADARELVKRADAALYEAKNTGKGRLRVVSADDDGPDQREAG